MYAVYIRDRLEDVYIPSRKAVFVFCEENNITKLATSPNVSMQLTYFDENLPIIFVLTNPDLTTIYENALPPNSYLLVLEKRLLGTLTAFEYIYTWCMTHCMEYALFAEWYTILSKKVADSVTLPVNMNKNPKYDWQGDVVYVDFSEWMENMLVTMQANNLSSLGVHRRNASDLLRLSSTTLAEEIPYVPIQLYTLYFDKLRELNAPINIKALHHTSNYFIRDSILAVSIVSLGGEIDTTDEFTINAPDVVYTETDLHLALNLAQIRRKGC